MGVLRIARHVVAGKAHAAHVRREIAHGQHLQHAEGRRALQRGAVTLPGQGAVGGARGLQQQVGQHELHVLQQLHAGCRHLGMHLPALQPQLAPAAFVVGHPARAFAAHGDVVLLHVPDDGGNGFVGPVHVHRGARLQLCHSRMSFLLPDCSTAWRKQALRQACRCLRHAPKTPAGRQTRARTSLGEMPKRRLKAVEKLAALE
ncbi:hypothetical protein GY15_17130 [Delftia sp. 670]|nr:hypothetical protein GY15_17130 [Delftia sp. 670]